MNYRTNRVELKGAKNGDDILAMAGLDYKVETVPLFTQSGPVNTGHRAVVRTDTGEALGVVGSKYVPVQTVDFVRAIEPVVKEHHLKYVSVFTIDAGRTVAIELELPEPLVLRRADGQEDVLRRRVTYRNSHDGSSQLSLMDLLLRQWCTNGATKILGMQGEHIRHTSGALIKVPLLTAGVGRSIARGAEVAANAQRLIAAPFSREQMEALAVHVFPAKDEERVSYQTGMNRYRMVELYERGQGNIGRTAWDALNAATEYATHHKTVRSVDAEPGTTRLKNIMLNGDPIVDVAYQFIEEAIA